MNTLPQDLVGYLNLPPSKIALLHSAGGEIVVHFAEQRDARLWKDNTDAGVLLDRGEVLHHQSDPEFRLGLLHGRLDACVCVTRSPEEIRPERLSIDTVLGAPSSLAAIMMRSQQELQWTILRSANYTRFARAIGVLRMQQPCTTPSDLVARDVVETTAWLTAAHQFGVCHVEFAAEGRLLRVQFALRQAALVDEVHTELRATRTAMRDLVNRDLSTSAWRAEHELNLAELTTKVHDLMQLPVEEARTTVEELIASWQTFRGFGKTPSVADAVRGAVRRGLYDA